MKKILIVDDAADARATIKHLFEKYPVEVIEAENGAAAWDIILKEEPDLILLDIHMPLKDGFELLEDLKEEWINTPVVIISNDDEEPIRKSSLYLGAKAFINKPLQIKDAEEIIKFIQL